MSKLDMRGLVIKDATAPLEIEITNAHVTAAQCLDEQKCVVAQSILAKFHGLARGVSVGRTYTKVILEGLVMRYRTPKALKEGLTTFDRTSKWELPLGTYTLLVPACTERLGQKSRGKYARRKKADTVVVAKALPVGFIPPRQVTRCPVVKSNRQVKQANRRAK